MSAAGLSLTDDGRLHVAKMSLPVRQQKAVGALGWGN